MVFKSDWTLAVRRSIALAMSVCLLWTSGGIAEAAGAHDSPLPNFPAPFTSVPPEHLGHVADYFNAEPERGRTGEPVKSFGAATPALPLSGSPAPLVILIQDLHAHYGVQKKIAGLLEFLSEKLRSRLPALGSSNTALTSPGASNLEPRASLPFALAVEGASGPVDSSVMALFPDQQIKEKAADYLMQEGELTGAEYFAVMHGYPDLLVGVENSDYYNLHRDLFRKTFQEREQLVSSLKGIQADYAALERRVYSKELRHFQRTLDDLDQSERSEIMLRAAKTSDERDLIQVERDLALLLRVANVQATEEEVRRFGPRLNQFVAFAHFLLTSNGLPAFNEQKTRELISTSVDYYSLALARNKPMVDNTLALLGMQTASAHRRAGASEKQLPDAPTLPRPDAVVLVAGGFHTAPITQLLRERNISYVVLTPTVDRLTDGDQALYAKRLNGELLTTEEILGSINQPTASKFVQFFARERSTLAVGLLGMAAAGALADHFLSAGLAQDAQVHHQTLATAWRHYSHLVTQAPYKGKAQTLAHGWTIDISDFLKHSRAVLPGAAGMASVFSDRKSPEKAARIETEGRVTLSFPQIAGWNDFVLHPVRPLTVGETAWALYDQLSEKNRRVLQKWLRSAKEQNADPIIYLNGINVPDFTRVRDGDALEIRLVKRKTSILAATALSEWARAGRREGRQGESGYVLGGVALAIGGIAFGHWALKGGLSLAVLFPASAILVALWFAGVSTIRARREWAGERQAEKVTNPSIEFNQSASRIEKVNTASPQPAVISRGTEITYFHPEQFEGRTTRVIFWDLSGTLIVRRNPVDGAIDLLKELAAPAADVKNVLVTGAESTEAHAAASWLGESPFTKIYAGYKDKEFAIADYLRAERISPGMALGVGDSQWDIEAFRKAGIRALGFIPTDSADPADQASRLEKAGAAAVISHDYTDTPAILTLLGATPPSGQPEGNHGESGFSHFAAAWALGLAIGAVALGALVATGVLSMGAAVLSGLLVFVAFSLIAVARGHAGRNRARRPGSQGALDVSDHVPSFTAGSEEVLRPGGKISFGDRRLPEKINPATERGERALALFQTSTQIVQKYHFQNPKYSRMAVIEFLRNHPSYWTFEQHVDNLAAHALRPSLSPDTGPRTEEAKRALVEARALYQAAFVGGQPRLSAMENLEVILADYLHQILDEKMKLGSFTFEEWDTPFHKMLGDHYPILNHPGVWKAFIDFASPVYEQARQSLIEKHYEMQEGPSHYGVGDTSPIVLTMQFILERKRALDSSENVGVMGSPTVVAPWRSAHSSQDLNAFEAFFSRRRRLADRLAWAGIKNLVIRKTPARLDPAALAQVKNYLQKKGYQAFKIEVASPGLFFRAASTHIQGTSITVTVNPHLKPTDWVYALVFEQEREQFSRSIEIVRPLYELLKQTRRKLGSDENLSPEQKDALEALRLRDFPIVGKALAYSYGTRWAFEQGEAELTAAATHLQQSLPDAVKAMAKAATDTTLTPASIEHWASVTLAGLLHNYRLSPEELDRLRRELDFQNRAIRGAA